VIEVEKLEKTFHVARHHRGFLGSLRNLVETESDVVRAVDGVSFQIAEGEFVGFIGPNPRAGARASEGSSRAATGSRTRSAWGRCSGNVRSSGGTCP